MFKKFIPILIISVIIFGFSSKPIAFQDDKKDVLDGYPTPTDKNMLFYIQKSFNTNAVVYTANIDEDGKLNPKRPVNVFWRRYQEDGRKRELKLLERTFAFGVNSKRVKGKENAYEFTLVSLKEFKLFVTQDKNGVAKIATIIDNKPARLKRVFVTAEHKSLLPKVFYVEVFGSDLKTGEPLYQRIDN